MKELTRYEKFRNSNFAQQNLKSFRPLVTPYLAIILLCVFLVIFICFSIAFHVTYSKIIEITQRYDDICPIQATDYNCSISIEIPENIESTMYFYFQLTKFYQGQRRYSTSYEEDQLKGEYVSFDDLSHCSPYRAINDQKNQILVPSGLSPASIFNDSFYWDNNQQNFKETGIADKHQLEIFQEPSPKYGQDGVYWLRNTKFVTPKNEHFVVWMNNNHLSTVRKLFMWCENCKLEKGTYGITINPHYPIGDFNGEKMIVLMTKNSIGSKNYFLGILSYIIIGLLLASLIGVVLLLVLKPRKLGDANLFEIQLQKRFEATHPPR